MLANLCTVYTSLNSADLEQSFCHWYWSIFNFSFTFI